ncbi:MAG: ABC transporter ATP-binding protein [Thermoleophilia bacterium]
MTAAIRCEALTKDFGGGRGVRALDLEVAPGEVFGFLGPNGAGKTTTIRLLLDLLRPTSGRALLLGLDARRDSLAVRRRTGYLPGELALYERLTGRELVAYVARLRRVGTAEADRLAGRLELDLGRRIEELSRGNKQKVGLVLALMHRPELLVLDEPTSGIDPLVQREFHALVREATAEGRTVFLSSHVLSEVERMADRVALVRDGRLVLVDEVAALKARAVRELELRFAGPAPDDAFRGLAGVELLEVEGERLRLRVAGSVDAALKAAARFEVVGIATREPGLEEIFLAYYGGGDAG